MHRSMKSALRKSRHRQDHTAHSVKGKDQCECAMAMNVVAEIKVRRKFNFDDSEDIVCVCDELHYAAAHHSIKKRKQTSGSGVNDRIRPIAIFAYIAHSHLGLKARRSWIEKLSPGEPSRNSACNVACQLQWHVMMAANSQWISLIGKPNTYQSMCTTRCRSSF